MRQVQTFIRITRVIRITRWNNRYLILENTKNHVISDSMLQVLFKAPIVLGLDKYPYLYEKTTKQSIFFNCAFERSLIVLYTLPTTAGQTLNLGVTVMQTEPSNSVLLINTLKRIAKCKVIHFSLNLETKFSFSYHFNVNLINKYFKHFNF